MNYSELYDKSGLADTLVFMGDDVKTIGGRKVGGYLVKFSTPKDPDLGADFFDKSTDFDIEDGEKRSLYYNHGFDPKIGNHKIGTFTTKKDDMGLWIEGQLREADEYADAVLSMVEQGKLGYSSGAVSHLVRRDRVSKSSNVHRISAWPLGEGSLTNKPAEPRTLAVPLKMWAEQFTKGTSAADEKPAAVSITTVREFETFLRDAGFPKDAAITIASKGYNALLRRDAEELDDQSDTFRADSLRELARIELQHLRKIGVAL